MLDSPCPCHSRPLDHAVRRGRCRYECRECGRDLSLIVIMYGIAMLEEEKTEKQEAAND